MLLSLGLMIVSDFVARASPYSASGSAQLSQVSGSSELSKVSGSPRLSQVSGSARSSQVSGSPSSSNLKEGTESPVHNQACQVKWISAELAQENTAQHHQSSSTVLNGEPKVRVWRDSSSCELDEETLRAGIVEFLSHLKSSDYEDPNCVAWRWLARGYEHTELTARVFLRDVRLWRAKEISDFEMIRRIDTEVVLTLTAMANKLPKLKAAGQWDEALQLVSKAESSSSDPDVWTAWKVGLLRDKGFLNQALEVALQWENQLRGRPVSPNRTRYGTQSALQQSYILLRLGRFAEAAASAQRALQWDARNKEALLYQALAYLYLRDENATQVALGQARKVEESIDWDLVEIALFRELKQWKRAEAVVAAAKKRYPSDGRLLYQETLLNLDQKKWKQAKLSYEALKDKDVDLAGRLAHLPVWKES